MSNPERSWWGLWRAAAGLGAVDTLFLQQSDGKDHVHSTSVLSETTLTFGNHAVYRWPVILFRRMHTRIFLSCWGGICLCGCHRQSSSPCFNTDRSCGSSPISRKAWNRLVSQLMTLSPPSLMTWLSVITKERKKNNVWRQLLQDPKYLYGCKFRIQCVCIPVSLVCEFLHYVHGMDCFRASGHNFHYTSSQGWAEARGLCPQHTWDSLVWCKIRSVLEMDAQCLNGVVYPRPL